MTDLSNLRIFVCTSPIKMNLSFDRLMGVAQETFDQDPLSGHLFLFFNRRRDRIKILFWDVDGLHRLLNGLDLKHGRRRKRYRRVG